MAESVSGSLELEAKDFGPIVMAKVDLRPLTVFVGPSNTGKSYLSILVYALHRYFALSWDLPSRISRGRRPEWFYDMLDGTRTALVAQARSLQRIRDAGENELTLSAPVAELLRAGFDDHTALPEEIQRCFGVSDSAALVRHGVAREARVAIRRTAENAVPIEHGLVLSGDGAFSTNIPADIPIAINTEVLQLSVPSISQLETTLAAAESSESRQGLAAAAQLLEWLGNLVLPAVVDPLHVPAYYLPADRTGVMHAHSLMVGSIVAGLRHPLPTAMPSGVLADFLHQLIEIDSPRSPTPSVPHARLAAVMSGLASSSNMSPNSLEWGLGDQIEKAILGGSVRVDRSANIGYPHFAYRPADWKNDLPLANASSMVSELAPLVLYLRHRAEPGDVLIVEEPEAHLHPAMQVELTRQLAQLVNLGVRLIVTTHSEWLTEELANIVQRSKLPEDQRKGPALAPDQVGVWLFEQKSRPKGSVVREIPLDADGMYPTGFDEVAMALHNDWAGITSQVEEGS